MSHKSIIVPALITAAVLAAIPGMAFAQQAVNFTVDVQARNVTRGQVIFQNSVDASGGDRIQVRVRVLATTFNMTNVIVKNNMPAGLVFSLGESGINTAAGFNIGDIPALTSSTLMFEVIATEGSPLKVTDTVSVRADGMAEKSDAVSITINEEEGLTRSLTVKHTVKNLTRGETVGTMATPANPGDRLRFEIEISAKGNTAQSGLELRYTISSRLALASGDPNLFINGQDLGSIAPGAKKTVSFEATALSGSAATVTNEARVRSAEVAEKKVKATVYIRNGNAQVPNQPESEVLGATTSMRAAASKTVAKPGDVIVFTLFYTNMGSASVPFAVSADVRDLMLLARISHTGNPAGVVDSGIIKFPQVTVPAGATIERSFQATVFPASQIQPLSDRTIILSFGNQVSVSVGLGGTVAGASTGGIQPPRTGASPLIPAALAAVSTAGFWLVRRKKLI